MKSPMPTLAAIAVVFIPVAFADEFREFKTARGFAGNYPSANGHAKVSARTMGAGYNRAGKISGNPRAEVYLRSPDLKFPSGKESI